MFFYHEIDRFKTTHNLFLHLLLHLHTGLIKLLLVRFHCNALHTLYCIMLQIPCYITLQCITLSYSVLHYITVYCITVQCITLHYSVLHYIKVYCIEVFQVNQAKKRAQLL